jgi:hypothetical protein
MAAPESECGGGDAGYQDLRDVSVEVDSGTARGSGGGGFAVCFWLYLSSSARPSSVILHQVGWILSPPRVLRGFQAMASVGIVSLGVGGDCNSALLLWSELLCRLLHFLGVKFGYISQNHSVDVRSRLFFQQRTVHSKIFIRSEYCIFSPICGSLREFCAYSFRKFLC